MVRDITLKDLNSMEEEIKFPSETNAKGYEVNNCSVFRVNRANSMSRIKVFIRLIPKHQMSKQKLMFTPITLCPAFLRLLRSKRS